MEQSNKIVLFENKTIRQIWQGGILYFSVVDVIEVLTESPNASDYWYRLKKREAESGIELSTFCRKMKMPAPDGKNRPTDCANTEGILRIIMSVPSPKAEPFKAWMAQLGKENIEETADPELGFERLRDLYLAKGYDEKWIESRLKSIGIRKELTEEWQKRGVTEGVEYAHLTAEIAKGTFGLSPSEHSKLKGLSKENLRDHMTNLELIFTMLGEESTRTLTVKYDSQGFNENRETAQLGGSVAREARQRLEKLSGEKVVSEKNFLNLDAPKKTDELGSGE